MWYVYGKKRNGEQVVFSVVATREEAMKAARSLQYKLSNNRAFCQVGAIHK